jgi:hypothetical protein
MITDSSKNYLDNTVTMVYDGEDISVTEIFEYCKKNYGVAPVEFDIEPPNEGFGGYPNPGIVKVRLPH